jgi:hypothetical protein
MDWKVKPAEFAFEKAKDVAAFANHLGGTLLVGVREVDGQLEAYVGMPMADAGACRDSYSKAVADRCQPRPSIDFEEYDDPNDATKQIVAINVQPSLSLVGVRVAAHRPTEGWGGDSYVFPVRSGTDARYLEPGQLPMFMTPQIRRCAIMLSRISAAAPVNVIYENTNKKHSFVGVVEEDNVVTLNLTDGNTGRTMARVIPLDLIRSVYQDDKKMWHVVVDTKG